MSSLIVFCKERESADRELENVLARFLRQRSSARRQVAEPWAQVERLAERVLSLESDASMLRAALSQAREAFALSQADTDRWRAAAERSGDLEQDEVRNHRRVVAELTERAEAREAELAQVRSQRDLLERELAESRAARAHGGEAADRERSEKEAMRQELNASRRAAQVRAQELDLQLAAATRELESLRELKAKQAARVAELEVAAAAAATERAVQERRRGSEQATIAEQTATLEEVRAALAERTAAGEALALRVDQQQVEYAALQKRHSHTLEEFKASQERMLRAEEGRVVSYKEQEQRLQEAFVQLEQARQRELQWKARLTAATDEARAARAEAARVAEDSAERIASLEQTLDGLVRNMQTVSVRNDRAEAVAAAATSRAKDPLAHRLEQLNLRAKAVADDDSDEDDEHRNVITEKANRLRLEIQSAAEAAFQASQRQQQPQPQQPQQPQSHHPSSQAPSPRETAQEAKEPARPGSARSRPRRNKAIEALKQQPQQPAPGKRQSVFRDAAALKRTGSSTTF